MGRDVGLTSLPVHADTSQGVGHLQIWTRAQKERDTEVSHEGPWWVGAVTFSLYGYGQY